MSTKLNKSIDYNQSAAGVALARQTSAAGVVPELENGASAVDGGGTELASGSGTKSTAITARTTKMASSASFLRKSHQQSPRPPSPSLHQQQRQFQDNAPQEREVLSKLPRMERMPAALYRWNTNEEIAAWLYSAQQHSEWCTLDVRIRPPNGSMLLYHKKGSNYKHDGYVWKKRKDGKLPREDHMRLKVKGVEIIYANYVHSALVPTFHRRSYWLLSYPDVVLVHYLNTPGEGEMIERIVPSLRACVSQYTRAELLEQLKPMLCCGPLTFDDQNQAAALAADGVSTVSETTYDERLRFVNALIDQARQSKAVLSSAPGLSQADTHNAGNASASMTTAGATPKAGQALVLTSVGGQFLLAIDAQSPAGTALLAAQQQQQQTRSQPSFRAPTPLETGQDLKSSSSTSSGSPPLGSLSAAAAAAFASPAAVSQQQQQQQQQQISRVLSGIRSNSCSSASRRVMCSTVMRRQPSAFSDGADDVFRPLSEAVTAASSSCSMAEMEGPILAGAAGGLNDSAYCSFADTKDDDNHGFERPRRYGRDTESGVAAAAAQAEAGVDDDCVVDFHRFLQPPVSAENMISPSQKGKSGDPMLPAVGESVDDSANLGLSQEDIATTLRANLAAMIDKPSTELFRALSPTRRDVQSSSLLNGPGSFLSPSGSMAGRESAGGVRVNRSMGLSRDGQSSPMDEGCTNFIPSSHLLSSPDSSFRLLNQILSGEDYGDEEADEHSMKSASGGKVDEENERKQSDASSYFQANTSSAENYYADDSLPPSSNIGALTLERGANVGGSAGSRAASCGSSQGSGGSMTGMRLVESRIIKDAGFGASASADLDGIADSAAGDYVAVASSASAGVGGVQTIQDEHRHRQGRGGRNAVATITDFSPDWSYTQGGTKILISGPWYSTSHRYNCLFGDVSVPACLIQTGVLRCYCPPHDPGTVSLMVCCDEQVISNSVMFEYRPNQQEGALSYGASDGARHWMDVAPDFWVSANESHFCMGLLERLEALEKNLVPSSSGSSDASVKKHIGESMDTTGKEATSAPTITLHEIEERLVKVCRRMAGKDWLPLNDPTDRYQPAFSHHCGMVIIHFAAALGFARLIMVLWQWYRAQQQCPRLEAELQFTKQDLNGRTALMWACIKGKTEAANLLARGCRDSLFISDRVRLGELPLAVAFRDGHVELVREVVQQFVAENGGDPNARDLDTALWVLTSGLVERSQLFYYNKRPYIHARRHQQQQCQQQSSTQYRSDVMDYDQRRQTFINGVNSTQANLRLRKQLSLDSQMIKPPLSNTGNLIGVSTSGQNQRNRQQQLQRGEAKKSGRECAKRASVERLEELMRDAASEPAEAPNGSVCRHYSESSGGVTHRATGTSDVRLTLSSKITRQDSENSSSVASYMSVEEWLKQPLSVEIPMDITVPDSPTASDMWETVAGSSTDHADNEGARAQMASLAQQIIDALPDRIKQETFVEEEYDGSEQQSQQYQSCFQDGSCTDVDHGAPHQQQPPPRGTVASNVSSAGDFVSYRHYDVATPCSSSLSPSSAQSPGLVIPPVCSDSVVASVNDPSKVLSGHRTTPVINSEQQSQHSVSMSPATFLTSPASSSGRQSRDVFLFPSPNCAASFTDAAIPQHGACGAGSRCCQQQQQQSAVASAEATNLGEFFNATRSRSPLECHFQELTLTDREQRQLYEAAKVIQSAYRQYRQRVQIQMYSDMERQAAVVIQTCYRRYRQYCYFKRLHQAAVLIQKHFRLYKAAKRSKMNPDGTTTSTPGGLTVVRRPSAGADVPHGGEEENLTGFTQFLENAVQQAIGNKDTTVLMTAQSTTPGTCHQVSATSAPCIRIQVTPEELMRWKQHLAAMRIQHAFRGHRKRQDAAARKIQKFMREARQKLQKARTNISSTGETGSAIAVINSGVSNTGGLSQQRQTLQQRQETLERLQAPLCQQALATAPVQAPETVSRPGCQCTQISSTRN